MKFSALLAALLAFGTAVSYADVLPMGCYPYATGGAYSTDSSTSMENCAAICTAQNTLYAYRYSFYFFNTETQQTEFGMRCDCGNSLGYTPVDWTYQQYCSQENALGPPITTVWLLQTTFSRLGCGGLTDYYERPFTQVSDFEACFQLCRESTYAFVDRLAGDNIRCSCSDDSSVFYPPQSCQGTNLQDYNWMIFQHPAGSTTGPSGWVKRQLRERLEREAGQKALAICPKGLTACQTFEKDDSSFECIDVSAELESCGGCIHGHFGAISAPHNLTGTGVDCSVLPGVSLEGVTCLLGECLAFSCEDGYDLKDNQCVVAM